MATEKKPSPEPFQTFLAEKPLFAPWCTRVFRIAIVAGLLGVVAIPTALLAWERTPYVNGTRDPKTQPVKFDHRHHVRDDGIACQYCHADAARSPHAGMPAASVCMGCHAQIWSSSPELMPIRDCYFRGAPLQWDRVTRVPDFVFFNHAAHVTSGVECTTCHGNVDQMASVIAVRPWTMSFCLDCHREPRHLQPNLSSALHPATDCTTCHR